MAKYYSKSVYYPTAYSAMSEMDAGDKFEYEISKKYKDDSLKMVAPFTNMESQLSAAPLCLQIMGNINILATSMSQLILCSSFVQYYSYIREGFFLAY